MLLLVAIGIAVATVIASAVRLQFDGRPFGPAVATAIAFSVRGSILALPLAILAKAFGADGSQVSFVFFLSLANINVVSISVAHLQQSFAGNPLVRHSAFRLAWDVCLVTMFFGLGYFVLGISAAGKLTLGLADSLYLSAVTLTTTGYGDVVPPLVARPLAMLESFLGYALLGLWVATLFQNAITSQRRAE